MAFFVPRFTTPTESYHSHPLFDIFNGPSIHSRPSPTISSHPLAAYVAPSHSRPVTTCIRRQPSVTPVIARKTVRSTFQPRFDVRETADAYHLHGELAGLQKKDVEIEFVDPQTLAIRGHIERNYSRAVPVPVPSLSIQSDSTKHIEESKPTEQPTEKPTEKPAEKPVEQPTEKPAEQPTATTTGDEMEVDPKPTEEATKSTEQATKTTPEEADHSSDTGSHKYQPTVEDFPDEDDHFSVTSMSSTPSHSSAASHAAAKAAAAAKKEEEKRRAAEERHAAEEKARKEAEQQAAKAAAAAEAEKQREETRHKQREEEQIKYWVQERSIGQFSRTFEFPRPIRQSEVHATLEDGVLNVVVPKARMETRRVIVF